MAYIAATNVASAQQHHHQHQHQHQHVPAPPPPSTNEDANNDDNSNDIEDQRPFELSQYTPRGIKHFSAQYRNDPRALERLSRRISLRVEKDSSDLIALCDKRIRKRRKKHKQEQEAKQQQQRQHHQQQHDDDALASGAPEIVTASDLMLGKCLGQGSFSSVFVLEKHLHRPPASTAAPRRGRRSKLATGTNQSTSHRGSSSSSSVRRFLAENNHSTSNHNNNNNSNSISSHSASRHTAAAATANKEQRTGRSPIRLRRRIRQRYKTDDDIPHNNGDQQQQQHNESSSHHHHRSIDRSSSSQRSRSLSPSLGRSNKTHNTALSSSSKNGRGKGNETTTRSRSLSRSIRNGLRACFGKSPLRRSGHGYGHVDDAGDEDDDEEKYYRQKIKRRSSEDNGSIFRGGSRSLSCHRRRRSRTRRSRSRDEITAATSRTSVSDGADNNNSNHNSSTHSCDAALASTPRRGVLWKKNFPDEEIDDSCGGGSNSNLVVKILQPKLMEQPKLFANCAAGLIREGLFLTAIDHPHVLKVHAWTSPSGWMDFAALSSKEGDLYDGYLLVLERLKGGSLKGWMSRWQQEHQREQRALATAAAIEEKERESHTRHRMARSLSFTADLTESASFSYKPDASEVSSPNFPKAPYDAAYHTSQSDGRSYPYSKQWPRTQLSDRASLLLQLSDTVKYLHKQRILHRDLKPDNLGVTFVDRHNDSGHKKQYPTTLSLKIFDFDIARLVPEEPNEEQKKIKRTASSGSVKSFDAEMLNNPTSNRSGRSISPFRTSSSLTGDRQQTRRKKGKYRGQRPRPAVNSNGPAESPGRVMVETNAERSVPSEVHFDKEPSVEGGPQRDALFEMTSRMGSPRYMAPEIARGERYNLRSEVYTVCLLVHEVLTLQKPYDELQPEDHGRLVHSDIPGYRPPIFTDWGWPSELEELLHMGWGDITQRPSMKDVNSVLKRALPKICPELAQQQQQQPRHSEPLDPLAPTAPEMQESKKGLLYQTGKRILKHGKKSIRTVTLTPSLSNASNSDYSFSDDDPLKTVE